MEHSVGEFLISDDKERLQIERIFALLQTSYWANERSKETIQKTIENSLCFGIYFEKEQIGFARCVSDYATTFLLMDVIIDNRFRGKGLGKALVRTVISHEKLRGLSGMLATRDAHGLYAQYGFAPADPNYYMKRPADQ